MPLRPDELLAFRIPTAVHTYAARDTVLYALSIGIGTEPCDPAHLRFLIEPGLAAFPSMATILGNPGTWMRAPETGIDWRQIVFGRLGIRLQGALPVAGHVIGKTRIVRIMDKGPSVGAIIETEREVRSEDGTLLCTVLESHVCRGDGGCGAPRGASRAQEPLPERPPDDVIAIATLPQSALIYRLNGEDHPIHVDPAAARAAGYPRPILHGTYTFAIAARAALHVLADDDPSRLGEMHGRFRAPCFPGEILETRLWRLDAGRFRFEVHAAGRPVLDEGTGRLAV